MVGRLAPSEKEAIARTVLALASSNKPETARQYREAGYRAEFYNKAGLKTNSSSGGGNRNANNDDNLLHRFATFHLDKIDLSAITLEDGETVEIVDVLKNTREVSVPSWVEQGRRLGGLLQGVSAQAARPISLAKEWKLIAKDALRQSQQPAGARSCIVE